jgi:hypothetical protein
MIAGRGRFATASTAANLNKAKCGLLSACRIRLERWFPKATVSISSQFFPDERRTAMLLEDYRV